MDDHLTAAGASWDPGPAAGEWIAPLLDEFGATLGHAVPSGYDAYVVVPIPADDDLPGRPEYRTLEALIEVIAPFVGEQTVHVALWEGWGWLYGRDEDPRTAPGFTVFVVGPQDPETIEQARVAMARDRVARPDVAPLALPGRNYFLWSGPLSSVAALRHTGDIPSLIWPEDRSWFIGAPIYTREIALGASERMARAVREAPSLRARAAGRHEVLEGDG
jgi:hypothetical protein